MGCRPDRMRELHLLRSDRYKNRGKPVCIYKCEKQQERSPDIYKYFGKGKAAEEYYD